MRRETLGKWSLMAVVLFGVGMILMLFGFFTLIAGKALWVSIAVLLTGIFAEILGFTSAFLAYRDSVSRERTP
jgi:hypothetical protein